MSAAPNDDLDASRFETHRHTSRGFAQAYVHEGVGGVPLLLVHGWPETKRIWWRVIEPLAAAGFEVIVPDLRGFGESDVAPDGFGDVAVLEPRPARPGARPPRATTRWWLVGGDLGGPIIQDLALRFPVLRRADGAVQLAAALRQGAHGRDAHPSGQRRTTTSCARAPTPTRWPPSWPRPTSAAATSPPSTRRGSGPIPAPSTTPPSPSTPSRSPTGPSCGPRLRGLRVHLLRGRPQRAGH